MNHIDLIQKVKSCNGVFTKSAMNKTKDGDVIVKYCSLIPYKFRKNPMICPHQAIPFELKTLKGDSMLVYKCMHTDVRYVNREAYDPRDYRNIK